MAKRIVLANFTGGLWIPVGGSTLGIPADALTEATNIDYSITGGITARRGQELFATIPEGTIVGLWRFNPRNVSQSSQTLAMVRRNSTVGEPYYCQLFKADGDSRTFTAVPGVLPDAPDWNAAVWPAKNAIYFAMKGNNLLSGGLYKYDGSSLSSISGTYLTYPGIDASTLKPVAHSRWTLDPGASISANGLEFASNASSGTITATFLCPASVNPGQSLYNLSATVTAFNAADVYFELEVFDGTTTVTTPISAGDNTLPSTFTAPNRAKFRVKCTLSGAGSGTRAIVKSLAFQWNAKTSGFVGPYVTVYKSQLVTTKNDALGYLVAASNVNSDLTWDSTNSLSVNDPQGGFITGLVPFGGALLIFRQTSIWRFDGVITSTGVDSGKLERISDEGCVAPKSIAVTPFGVIYVGRTGVFLTDGTATPPTELSRPIRGLFVQA